MTYKTHRKFSVTGACIACCLMYSLNTTLINYYVAYIIVCLTSAYGAKFPDFDHHWGAIKDKNVPTWLINKALRLSGGIHRSAHTHSIDIMLFGAFLSYYIISFIHKASAISLVNFEISSLILFGFFSGWASHLFADMLTSGGVRVFFWCKFKLALVPKKLFSLRFNTGNEWEEFVYKLMLFINFMLGIFVLVYPYLLHKGYI